MILFALLLTCAFPACGKRAYGSDTRCPHTKAAPHPSRRGCGAADVVSPGRAGGRAAGQALRRVGTAAKCRCGAGRAGAGRAPALMASVASRSASSISSWEAYPAKYGWMK